MWSTNRARRSSAPGRSETQVHLQPVVHSPVPLFEPSSHSSPVSTTPLPHTAAPGQTWFLQVLPFPHGVPSPGGVPAAHVCDRMPASLSPMQLSTPLHGLWSSQRALPLNVSGMQT